MSLCPSACLSLFTKGKGRTTGLSTLDCKFWLINELNVFYILTAPVEWNPELHFSPGFGRAINGIACWRRTWGLVFVKHREILPCVNSTKWKASAAGLCPSQQEGSQGHGRLWQQGCAGQSLGSPQQGTLNLILLLRKQSRETQGTKRANKNHKGHL